MKWLREHISLVSIFLLALAIRLLYNVTVGRHYYPIYDDKLYYLLAQNLTNVGKYSFSPDGGPVTSRAPFWPYVMSVIFFFTRPQPAYARLFLSFLGSGTCVLIFLFAQDLFGRRSAVITGIIAAIYPCLFIYDGWLYTESVYTFLITAFCYSLYRLQRHAQQPPIITENIFLNILLYLKQVRNRRRWLLLCGITLACASLTRPNGPILLGVVFAWAFILVLAKTIRWRTAVRWTLVITVLTAAIIAPWTLRNYRAANKTFILIATGSGNVLSGVYNDTVLTDPQGPGMWEPMEKIRPPIDFHGHNCCDYTGEADNTAYALNWIRTHLSDMPYLLSLHFLNMWIPYTSEEGLPFREFPTRISSQIVWNMIWYMTPIIFLLAALGLIVTWHRYRKQLIVVYLVIATTILLNIAYYGSSRFRAPIEPLLVLLAGGAIWWLTSNDPGTLRALRRKKEHMPRTSDTTSSPEPARSSTEPAAL